MYSYSTKLLSKIRKHIRGGGVIAYPTEYCYGLGCDPLSRSAINALLKIKGRSKNKGLIVIAATEAELASVIQPLSATDRQEIFTHYWPGSFSLLLPANPRIPRNLIGRHSKIAVRITKHSMVRQLCHSLNMPLISTSANLSGHKAIRNYRECARQFGDRVMVLPGLTSFAKKPSTIIDYSNKTIIR